MSNIGMKLAGVAGVLVVLGGGCAAAYAFSDTVKNQVKLRTSSPEDYFQWVCEKNISDLSDASSAAYQKYLDRTGDSAASSCTFRYDPSDEAKNLLLDNMNGADDRISSVIRNINSVELKTDAAGGKGNISEQFRLLVNDNEITTAEAAACTDDASLYLRVPELSEQWIKMPEVASGTSMNFVFNPQSYLSASDCADMVSRYASVPPAHMQNITIEKKQSVQIGEITTEYTAMTAELTIDELVSMLTELTDKAASDEALLKMMPDSEEFSAQMTELGDKLREAAEMDTAGMNIQNIPVTTYVDPTGTIRGIYTAPAEGSAFFAAVGMNDGQIAASVKCSVMSKNLINFNIVSDKTGTGHFSGSLMSYQDESLNISGNFNNIQFVNEKGYISGDISVTFNDYDPFSIKLTSDGSSQNVSGDLNIEGKNFGSVTVTYSDKSDISVQEPDRAGAFIIDENTHFDIASYTDQSSLTEYVCNVLTRIGVEENDAKEAALSVGATFFLFQ